MIKVKVKVRVEDKGLQTVRHGPSGPDGIEDVPRPSCMCLTRKNGKHFIR